MALHHPLPAQGNPKFRCGSESSPISLPPQPYCAFHVTLYSSQTLHPSSSGQTDSNRKHLIETDTFPHPTLIKKKEEKNKGSLLASL